MIGAFFLNNDNEVCLAQYGVHKNIASLRIVPTSCCIAVLDDGNEEMFTHEIDQRIFSPMIKQSEILIAHVGEGGKAVTEYVVLLSVQL